MFLEEDGAMADGSDVAAPVVPAMDEEATEETTEEAPAMEDTEEAAM